MIRETLIRRTAEASREPLGIVEQIVDTALAEIRVALLRGDDADMHGFGIFAVDDVPPRDDRPPYCAIRFRACHDWRRSVNKTEDA